MDEPSQPAESSIPKLEDGAVAILDALGFKGIWKTPHPSWIVESLSKARNAARRRAKFENTFGSQRMNVATFSDTIVITTQPEEPSGRPLFALTHAAAGVCASKGRVPLAFRGCITVGKVLVSEDVFIGDAMDEAAQWYEAANASLVWLTPAAAAKHGIVSETDLEVMPWEVPLKGGVTLETLVVNPFSVVAHASDEYQDDTIDQRLDELEARLLARLRLSAQIDVVAKRQNTMRFLREARAYTLRKLPAFQRFVLEALGASLERVKNG
jgi:hypothetical protein